MRLLEELGKKEDDLTRGAVNEIDRIIRKVFEEEAPPGIIIDSE